MCIPCAVLIRGCMHVGLHGKALLRNPPAWPCAVTRSVRVTLSRDCAATGV